MTNGQCAQLACIWEATARKPGNVHPWRSFEDVSYADFLLSAVAIGPVFDNAANQRVGEIVLNAIRATRQVVSTNTNLGIVLLLAPLAKATDGVSVSSVLRDLNLDDSRNVQEAIHLTQAGGLDEIDEHDVRETPTLPLREWMALAKERDMIARQYANDFHDVLMFGVETLGYALQHANSLEETIIWTQLSWLAEFPDSLIARKLGPAEADEASRKARQILDAGWPHAHDSRNRLERFDDWLRAKQNKRNPGTTADLVTACLFVALRTRIISLPLSKPFSASDEHDRAL